MQIKSMDIRALTLFAFCALTLAPKVGAETVIDDFTSTPAEIYFHGTWSNGGALIKDHALNVVSGNSKGGVSVVNRSIDLSKADSLKLKAKLQPGNEAESFQVILTDGSGPKNGQTSRKARFSFSLAALKPEAFSDLTSAKKDAVFYTSSESNPAIETPIPPEQFDFSKITAVSYQGDYGDRALKISVKSLAATP
jgi:hypothetical protein